MSWQDVAKEFGVSDEWLELSQKAFNSTPLQRMAEEIEGLREQAQEHVDTVCIDKERADIFEKLAKSEAKRERLREALRTISEEYGKPPYTEFDWYAWKQRAEKALAAEDE